MSDTPRTDAVEFKPIKGMMPPYNTVPSSVSRELERELAEANQRIEKLELWKDQAFAVESEWDPNAIATMLGGELGQSQRKVIMEKVPKLLAKIQRLVEAGDMLDNSVACGCGVDGPCRRCSKAIENWTAAKEEKL